MGARLLSLATLMAFLTACTEPGGTSSGPTPPAFPFGYSEEHFDVPEDDYPEYWVREPTAEEDSLLDSLYYASDSMTTNQYRRALDSLAATFNH